MKIILRLLQIIVGLGLFIGLLSIFMAILSRFVKRPENLGVTNGQLAPCPNMPNCVSSQSNDPRHAIAPIPYGIDAEQAQAVLSEHIRSLPLAEVITEEPGYLYAEFRTKGMGYTDDVEFLFDDDAKVIHFRSSARLPYSDWGVNRNRMEEIRSHLLEAEAFSP